MAARQVRHFARGLLYGRIATVPPLTMGSGAGRYLWADQWETPGFCVAMVESLGVAETLGALIRRPETGIVSTGEARAWADQYQFRTDGVYATTVEATDLNGWTVAVELNGYEATLPDCRARISERSRAVVVYRSVNADMVFVYAVEGNTVREFDPLLYDGGSTWRGTVRLPEEDGLRFGLGHPLASAFACAERLTRLVLTQELLDDRESWRAVGHLPSP